MTDDATFEEIEKAEALGAKNLLLCGYPAEAEPPLLDLLAKCGQADHRVLFCTKTMVGQTLGEALDTDPDALEEAPAPPDALPRVLVLSGLPGQAMQEFVDGFAETGLPRPVFASTTEHNLGFMVRDLLRELLSEQRAMRRGGRPAHSGKKKQRKKKRREGEARRFLTLPSYVRGSYRERII